MVTETMEWGAGEMVKVCEGFVFQSLSTKVSFLDQHWLTGESEVQKFRPHPGSPEWNFNKIPR